MKKKLLLVLFTITCGFSISAQDLIEQTSGEIINCKIQKEDSDKVYFKLNRNDRVFETFISKSEVKSIKYENNVQDTLSQTPTKLDKTSMGLGFGMDFGGIGLNLLIYPHKNVGIFVGLGYAFAGLGFNVGTKIRMVSETSTSKFKAYGLAMYGYNAAIGVSNMTSLNKLFYGPTFGFGFDFKSNSYSSNYWTFALLIPIRSSKVDEYIKDLKTNHNVEFKNSLPPVGFTVGYRFGLN